MRLLFQLTALVSLCLAINQSLAQFNDVSEELGTLPPVATSYNGNGASFADFNNDGWDDLSFGRGVYDPVFFVNNEGEFEPAPFSIPNIDGKQIMMLLWADYDGDGDMDLLITKSEGKIELWNNDGNFNFTEVAQDVGLATPNLFLSGAAFCDYDHDGDLDLYVATFYHPTIGVMEERAPMFFRNNGDGTFTNATIEVGLELQQRPMFQPLFMDIDGDGWEDLYLITDRVFVENALFKNNGDGTFTNITESSGAGIMICSMTGTVGDYDNDGDLDVFISNSHVVGSKLMRNNGDETFTEVASELGVNQNQLGWGGMWLDYDNDTWQDLFMGLTNNGVVDWQGNRFFRNEEGQGFTNVSSELGIAEEMTETYVAIMADFDHDGYYDYFNNNKNGYSPTLFKNTTGENNYISVTLEGTLSNGKGIGSWIKCYADGHEYVRFKLCGENLVGQNGDRIVFGLGQHDHIDSLVVSWNRGTRDVFYDLEPNQNIHVIEGLSEYLGMPITTDGSTVLCQGMSVTLSIGEFDDYQWSNGETGSEITITEPGIYTVELLTPIGVYVSSESIEITIATEPNILVDVAHQTCAGVQDGAIFTTVENIDYESLIWDDGSTELSHTNIDPGTYSFVLTDSHGCEYSVEVMVLAAEPLDTYLFTEDVTCFGESDGMAEIFMFGGTPPFDYDWGEENPQQLSAGVHEVNITDGLGCSIEVNVVIEEPDPLQVQYVVLTPATETELASLEAFITGGIAPYELICSAGEVSGTQVFGLPAGWHTISVIDAHGCSVEHEVEIEQVTSITEKNRNECTLFPNPARDWVQLGCDPPYGTEFTVHSAAGRLVIHSRFDGRLIDVSGLVPGYYVFTLLNTTKPERMAFIRSAD